uniref:Arrestin domain-containing protein 3 n=1 Tax=Callorhinchus milii TaxID=7868 RepID=A0A4W3JMX1_CALMI
MGKVKIFAITYDDFVDNIAPMFSSGDFVSGRVTVEVIEETKLQSLTLHVRGEAKVHWTESNGTNSSTSYSKEVKYFDYKNLLLGQVRGKTENDLITIPPGINEYPFRFMLPNILLPATVKGEYGNVSYWVKAKLHRPRKLTMKVKEEFAVFERFINYNPLWMLPQEATNDKTLCCWCCSSGQISLRAKIEQMGYMQGEVIQIFAEFENISSRTVIPNAVINQIQTFIANRKSKIVSKIVARLQGDPLLPGATERWNGKVLQIPTSPPSYLSCSIITIEYILMVYLFIPSAIDLKVNLPLVISSVPSQCDINRNWLFLTLTQTPEGKNCFWPCHLSLSRAPRTGHNMPNHGQTNDLQCCESLGSTIFLAISNCRRNQG